MTLAALQGATIPPISASMRSLWSQLVPEETLESAYAFDAIQLELVFVIGPLIAAGLATAVSPAAGLLLCAASTPRAAAASHAAGRASAAADDEVERTRAGALRSPGMRTLVLVGAITAISFGGLEVALPAFAEAEGLAGRWVRSSRCGRSGRWSAGSGTGGGPGARRSRSASWSSWRCWRSASAPLPFAPSIGVMGVLLVLTGLALAPLATTEYALVGQARAAGTATEAYSWQIVANVMGAAAGSFIAGVLAEEASVEWALATAGIACAAASWSRWPGGVRSARRGRET